ncbi:MAG: hypothetical protein CMP59_07740 [Flavobacteriales bacterium]|nr:hypothetical protein [Flavobacteriales bacterium]
MKENEQALFSTDSLIILSKSPSWPIRWGVTVISGTLLIAILFASIVKLPEKVDGRVQLIKSTALNHIYPNSGGYIEKILVKEGEEVEKDQLLAILHKSGQIKPTKALQILYEDLQLAELDTQKLLNHSYQLELESELNTKLSRFSRSLKDLIDEREIVIIENAQNYYENKLRQLKESKKVQKAQLDVNREELKLAHLKFQTDSLLFEEKVIPLQAYRNANEAYLRSKANYLGLSRSIQQNELQIIETKKSRIDQLHSQKQKLNLLRKDVEQHKEALISGIEERLAQTIIKANSDGIIHIHEGAIAGTMVSESEALFAIEAIDNKIYGLAKIKSSQSGKLKPGLKALLELDAYSASEYGYITAELIEIGELLSEDEYQLKLLLPKQLRTSSGIIIPYKAQMTGRVFIICESMTLLERIINLKRF